MHGKPRKSARSSCDTPPNDPIAESGQQPAFPRRSASEELHARHGDGTKKGCDACVETRRKLDARSHSQPYVQHRDQAYRTTTRRRFQHHAPPTHHTQIIHASAGGVAEICRFSSMTWRLPWDWVIVVFSKPTSTFWHSTKRHSTNVNSCHTSSFGHADRAISRMIPMSLRDERSWFWRVLSSAPTSLKYPVFWRLERT